MRKGTLGHWQTMMGLAVECRLRGAESEVTHRALEVL